MKRVLSILIVLVAVISTVAPSRAQGVDREYIILSGGPSLIQWEKFKAVPHDRWWGNFIRTARVRVEQLREQVGPDALITWLVYAEGYKTRSRQDQADLIGNILSVRDKYRINLVFFDKSSEVINYLNRGRNRAAVPIANFEYFGHSNKACFMFDYSNYIDSASKCWLHEDDLKQINKGIFTKDAFIKSWGCHTGESMSQKWRAATGTRMWGAIGKTDYSPGTYVVLSSAGGKWVR